MANKNVNKLLHDAAMEAFNFKHEYIGTEHMLLSMLKQEGAVSQILLQFGAKYEIFHQIISQQIGKGSAVVPPTSLTPRVKRVLEKSEEKARELGHNYIGTEHILLALLEEKEGFSTLMLQYTGISVGDIKRMVLDSLKNGNNEKNPKQKKDGLLSKYCRDLNQMARDSKIDPVIGREKEIERIIQVLSRRTKNNPVLVGEPGVGKTAIAEGLAQRIIEGKIPEIMREKIILSLDLASLLAGTKYRGDFEERIKGIINEVVENENIVLFIDELHTIIGAGGSEGSLNASNILKPFLAKGELQMVGATTLDEYRKHIEKDTAFERRLQPITIEEPSVEETIVILKGIRDKYEMHHDVNITDEALIAAVELSDRYLSDRFLPDKAIDLIDEAASMLRVKNYVAPNDLKELKTKLEDLNKEKEEAITIQNFEKAAKLRDDIKELKDDLDKCQQEWEQKRKKNNVEVRFDHIAKIVSDWSNVPVTKLTMEESKKYLNLDKDLKKMVIGQDNAIDSISYAIKRARVGLSDPKKPIGSFIFVGPTGVGKTYLAKSISKAVFGDENSMIRIDMSEYMEKHSVSRLIGSPPGYVGYDDGGQLTEAVRRKPYSVLLFDEIEKAHPDVFHILLQILDDGRLTDSKGRIINFKNTIIILTSNVGVKELSKKTTLGFETSNNVEKEDYERMKEVINEQLKKTFNPEFLNRISDIVVFRHLKEADIEKIVKIIANDMEKRLEKIEINIQISDKAIKKIAKSGYDEVYGARPLQRTIENLIENQLSEEILAGKIQKFDKILIDYNVKDDKIIFENIQKINA